MFIDKAKIKIKAGNGGNGAKTFYSSKLVNLGGPDGGDGGRGGDVLFRADGSMSTLLDFKYKSSYFAGDGGKGEQQNRTGKNGANMAIRVPCGTVVKDLDGDVIADLLNDGEEKVVLRGGSGGHGNKYYATSTRRAPNFSQLGETTEAHAVILELKTIADAGLIGFPSVGKSLILSKVSDARPKVADYHFTTLSPNLGVVRYYGDSFVVADIPGLIEGAAQGAGLGFEFLRHIERVRLLLHVVDISGGEGRDPYEDYLAVRKELKSYGNVLAKLPEIIVFNKCDLLPYDGNSQFTIHNSQLEGSAQLNDNAEWNGHFSLSQPVTDCPSKENSPTKKEKSVGKLSSGHNAQLEGGAQCAAHSAQLKDNAQCRMHNAQLTDNAQSDNKAEIENYELSIVNCKEESQPDFSILNSQFSLPELWENHPAVLSFLSRLKKKAAVFCAVSAATGAGIKPLLDAVYKKLKILRKKPAPIFPENAVLERPKEDIFTVVKKEDGLYFVAGGAVEKLARTVVLNDPESFAWFQQALNKRGVMDELKRQGLQNGDTVKILDIEFDYVE